jgi:NADH:ubiquinone oxidoreductase subunit 4 (subunit M)
MYAALIAALVVLGFYPQPLITTARQTVTAVQQMTAGSPLSPEAMNAAQTTIVDDATADGEP